MRALRFGLAAALVIIEAAAATALVVASNHDTRPWLTAGFAIPAGLTFVAAGLVALWRRPDNVTGSLLAATGYLWFIAALTESNNSWLFTIGFVFSQPRLRRVRRADPRLSRRAPDAPRRDPRRRRRPHRVDRQPPRGARRREPVDGLRRLPAERGRGRRLADGRLGRDARLDRDHRRRPGADRGDPRRPLAPRLGHEPADAPPRLPLLRHLARAADGLGRARLGLGAGRTRSSGCSS